MQSDPNTEWQRLSEHYRQMGDEELRELADDFGNLTDTAQQALRSVMRSRGLGDPQNTNRAPETWRPAFAASQANIPAARATMRIEPEPGPENSVVPLGQFGRTPQIVPDEPNEAADDEAPHEYTWKTVLCDCDTNEQARDLAAALHQAGLDSWVQQAVEFGSSYARVLVAADQLEAARAIAANPIPQEIVTQPEGEVPEFEEPECPKCASGDVVLVGVDTGNNWQCEQCGEEWSDAAEVAGREPENPGGETP